MIASEVDMPSEGEREHSLLLYIFLRTHIQTGGKKKNHKILDPYESQQLEARYAHENRDPELSQQKM